MTFDDSWLILKLANHSPLISLTALLAVKKKLQHIWSTLTKTVNNKCVYIYTCQRFSLCNMVFMWVYQLFDSLIMNKPFIIHDEYFFFNIISSFLQAFNLMVNLNPINRHYTVKMSDQNSTNNVARYRSINGLLYLSIYLSI